MAPNGWVAPKTDDKEEKTLLDLNSVPLNLNQSNWVELPDCKGLYKEITLAEDHENAVFATCKHRPGTAPVAEAFLAPTK